MTKILATLLAAVPALALAAPTAWNVDPSHSQVGFAVKHLVISNVRGEFKSYQGKIALDEADLARSSVEATIDVNTIDTRVPDRDTHLKSPDFLDVARYPEITFKAERSERLAPERLSVSGVLTIRGVARPVVLDVEYAGRTKDPWGHERAGFTAKTSIDRKDFGLTWNQLLETGGVVVGDRVDIEIEVEAVKQADGSVAQVA